jgi:CheY-like chemotaxis protein
MSDVIVPTKRRVLIVEDHARTRNALVFLLQRHNYEACVAPDGRQARDILLDSDGPTLALLDWMLPEMTGIEVCREIRRAELERYIYVIIVTGRDESNDLFEAFAAGADDFIRKPCDPMELLARLRGGERVVELERRLCARVRECEEAVERVRQMKRLLPICMYCKKVRDDESYWQEIDEYIHTHTGTDFSHGICPECMSDIGGERKSAVSRAMERLENGNG